MRKLLIAMMVCSFVWTGSLGAQSAAPVQGQKMRIALMNCDWHAVQDGVVAWFGSAVDVGQGITDLLTDDLVNNGTYAVLERQDINKVLAEQNFSNSDRADPTAAARIGKLLGANAIVVCSVTQFGRDTKKIGLGGHSWGWHGFGGGGLGHSKTTAIVGISARIVDVNTGQILAVADGKGESSRGSTSLGGFGSNWSREGGGHVNFGDSNFQQTIVGEAVKQATDQVATALEADDSRIPVHTIQVNGVVAAVVNGQVVLNVGSGAGLRVGDKLSIERVTMTIKDPTTGKVLRRMTSPMGEVQVMNVDAVSAVCNVLSGSGFKVGDLAQSAP